MTDMTAVRDLTYADLPLGAKRAIRALERATPAQRKRLAKVRRIDRASGKAIQTLRNPAEDFAVQHALMVFRQLPGPHSPGNWITLVQRMSPRAQGLKPFGKTGREWTPVEQAADLELQGVIVDAIIEVCIADKPETWPATHAVLVRAWDKVGLAR